MKKYLFLYAGGVNFYYIIDTQTEKVLYRDDNNWSSTKSLSAEFQSKHLRPVNFSIKRYDINTTMRYSYLSFNNENLINLLISEDVTIVQMGIELAKDEDENTE